MGINLCDLNAKQRALISPENRADLKIKTNEEYREKALKGTEKFEHDLVLSWARRRNLEPIHAPCHRKVHDLPPGWPDFTFCVNNQVLFIEMKVAGGRLSEDQKKMHALLLHLGNEVHITGSSAETWTLLEKWLENFNLQVQP